jgi:hypothetical protein
MGREEVEAVPRSPWLSKVFIQKLDRERERLRRSKQFLLRGKTDDAHHAQEGKANGGRDRKTRWRP